MVRRIIREILIGATASGAAGNREEPAYESQSKAAIVHERHQFQESIELLNAMRRVGGVRRIARGTNDNGAPVGQISERVMRHTTFDELHSHIVNDTEFDGPAQWGQFGEAVRSETPMDRNELLRMQASAEQKRRAVTEVHQPKHVRTLQDDLFGR